jgi:hypothetical protein
MKRFKIKDIVRHSELRDLGIKKFDTGCWIPDAGSERNGDPVKRGSRISTVESLRVERSFL